MTTNAPTGRNAVGRSIFKEAVRMFNRDRQSIILPIIGVGVSIGISLAVIGLWVGLSIAGVLTSTTGQISWIPGLLAAILFSVVFSIVQAAVVWMANERFEGRATSVSAALSAAFAKFRPLAAFGLYNATIGTILRQVRQEGGLLGGLVSLFGSIAWAVASYFVTPVIMFEGLGSFAAIKRSTELIKSKWQGAARANIVAGLAFAAAWVIAFIGLVGGFTGLIMNSYDNPAASAAGGILAAVSVVFMFAISLVQSTIMAYVRVALYRYAVGAKLGDFDPTYLDQAFVAKKGKFA